MKWSPPQTKHRKGKVPNDSKIILNMIILQYKHIYIYSQFLSTRYLWAIWPAFIGMDQFGHLSLACFEAKLVKSCDHQHPVVRPPRDARWGSDFYNWCMGGWYQIPHIDHKISGSNIFKKQMNFQKLCHHFVSLRHGRCGFLFFSYGGWSRHGYVYVRLENYPNWNYTMSTSNPRLQKKQSLQHLTTCFQNVFPYRECMVKKIYHGLATASPGRERHRFPSLRPRSMVKRRH